MKRLLLFLCSLFLAATLHANVTVVGEADNIRSGLDVIKKTHPNVAVIDISLKGSNGRYQDLLDRTVGLRGSAGEALHAFVNHSTPGPVPTLKKRWVEAMYWFGEARRESADFVSLVKAGIALDILTQGKKAGGILELCCGLFDLEKSDVVANNDMTLERVVTAIYDDGRSQLSHGGRLGLLQEIPVSKQLAIDFSAKVLMQYLSCLVKYNGPDDVDSLLPEIPRLRT